MHHYMTHAERTGTEAGNVAAGLERIAGGFGTVEDFQAIAGWVIEHDQVFDVTLVGERARAARNFRAGRLDPCCEHIERGGVRDLPAEEADALAAVDVD